MSDSRHKKSPPPASDEEPIDDDLRKQFRETLEANAVSNRIRRLSPGDRDYLVSSQAELAEAIGTSKRMVSRILGPVRGSSKPVRLVDRSAFVKRIREALRIPAPEMKTITVKASRAEILERIAEVSDDAFQRFKDAVQAAQRSGARINKRAVPK